MTKDEAIKIISNCKNDEKLELFLQNRINELEGEAQERTVGQDYTTTFQEYISSKTHYKPVGGIKDHACPDLVYDDYEPYFELFKEIYRLSKGVQDSFVSFEPFLFDCIKQIISHYTFDGNRSIDQDDRDMFYFSAAYREEKAVRISQFKHKSMALCSENSGMAHNMFKILGMDSEVVMGSRNNNNHAYNLFFPNGYGNIPAVLVDFSFPAKCESKSSHKVYDLPYYKVLSEEEYHNLMEGKPISINATKSISHLLNFYKSIGSIEEDCTLIDKVVTYSTNITYTKSKII